MVEEITVQNEKDDAIPWQLPALISVEMNKNEAVWVVTNETIWDLMSA